MQRLKGSNKTRQPLVRCEDPDFDEYDALTTLAQETPKGQPLFPMTRIGFYFVMQRAGKKAGIAQTLAHPHILRHSIAHHLIDQTGVPVLQTYLGHACGASTLIYTKLDDAQACAAVAGVMGWNTPAQAVSL